MASRALAASGPSRTIPEPDELRDPERQRRQVGALDHDEGEEELVPGGDEREQRGHHDSRREEGATIPYRIWNRLAPSTAASSRSRGIPLT